MPPAQTRPLLYKRNMGICGKSQEIIFITQGSTRTTIYHNFAKIGWNNGVIAWWHQAITLRMCPYTWLLIQINMIMHYLYLLRIVNEVIHYSYTSYIDGNV